ncbi:hypothetical protein AVDCRST_MAG81-5048 [uncultured Synechococcales cyanobacterium]|uniref:Uncharacterized protein n=1 Tax=uncultured Synechococcales cyanobacterium TaxID=1936017 RepID=A0A6J4VXC3_9CYAN|nr:hypothetical protein AVDCRST_MAG81-5048 [uncultured Synechococcales cyanobacterium]
MPTSSAQPKVFENEYAVVRTADSSSNLVQILGLFALAVLLITMFILIDSWCICGYVTNSWKQFP